MNNQTLYNIGYANAHSIMSPEEELIHANKLLEVLTHQLIFYFILATVILFIYVLYNNFFKKPTIVNIKIPEYSTQIKIPKIQKPLNIEIKSPISIDIDELAIIPAVMVLMIAISF